jgi:hypothetical protein
MDFGEILAQATVRERTVRLCLRGDLVDQVEQAAARLAAAQAQAPMGASLAGDGTAQAARELEALSAAMEPYTVAFVLRGLPRPAYKALVAAHPPRQDPDGKILDADREENLNTDTFWRALIRACLAAPEMTPEQFGELVDVALTDGQISELYSGALIVCRGSVDLPLLSAVSRRMATSANASRRHSDSGSASNASTGGSLATPSPATPPEG